MSPTQTRARQQNGRGADNAPVKTEPAIEQVEEAVAYEEAIRAEADAVWDAASTQDDVALTPALFRKLHPLLRRPIHAGHIVEVSAGKGKPYASKGIRSLQVQVDRLDNVLTPLHWSWDTLYTEDGRLAHVIARIGPKSQPLVEREAYGGVDRGSTLGNTYKGTETNAGKLALARLGPGHEVYVGAADLDPDVNEEAAEAQAVADTPAPLEHISGDSVARLIDLAKLVGVDGKRLQVKLGSMGVAGAKSANQAFATLTPSQAIELEGWLSDQADAAAADDDAEQPQLGGDDE